MENASKALIIAGAILLSILIIGLGMFIYTQAANVMNDTGLDAQEIQSYNEQFERYEGEAVKGAQIKAMISTVRNHNNATRTDVSKMVQLFPDTKDVKDVSAASFKEGEDPNASTGYAKLSGAIKAGQQYLVQCGHDEQTGLVTAISYIPTAGNNGGTPQ